jgi:hypothetical protein
MPKPKPSAADAAPYPHASIAFYGADDRFATKVVAAIFQRPQDRPSAMRRWLFNGIDVREDPGITREIVEWVKSHGVTHSTIAEEIMGCPHEEGIDYPAGETCPLCVFWQARRLAKKSSVA